MSQNSHLAPIHHLVETGSTNADAMARALAGEALPVWVRADVQTAGRGRAGRTWDSRPGNLHTSLAILTRCDPQLAPQLSLVAGVAVIEALRHLEIVRQRSNSIKVALKWPNDIMVGDAKLGGILIETAYDFGRKGLIAVIGFGMNVVAPGIINHRTVTLAELGFGATALELQDALAGAMAEALLVWDDGAGFHVIRARWLDSGMKPGMVMGIHAGAGVVSGLFEGLDIDGALLMRDETGRVQRFTFGDVTL